MPELSDTGALRLYDAMVHEFLSLGEYAQVFVEKGQEEADRRFPKEAAHLETDCVNCKSDFDELVTALRITE